MVINIVRRTIAIYLSLVKGGGELIKKVPASERGEAGTKAPKVRKDWVDFGGGISVVFLNLDMPGFDPESGKLSSLVDDNTDFGPLIAI